MFLNTKLSLHINYFMKYHHVINLITSIQYFIILDNCTISEGKCYRTIVHDDMLCTVNMSVPTDYAHIDFFFSV